MPRPRSGTHRSASSSATRTYVGWADGAGPIFSKAMLAASRARSPARRRSRCRSCSVASTSSLASALAISRLPGRRPRRHPVRSPNCPKGKVALASAPSASSAALPGTCRGGREPGRQLSSQPGYAGPQGCCSELAPDPLSLTLLTGLTVFSGNERIRITLLPARPSRLNAISIPSARRNVCARDRHPSASAARA